MSQLSSGILGGVAVALTFGAVQLASGRDLYTAFQQSGFGFSELQAQAAGPASPVATPIAMHVNRAAKSDRAYRTMMDNQTRTISVRLDRLSDTSILVRIPVAGELPNLPVAPATNSESPKATVACEPVVSVLTDVAKRLQPGRCIT